VTDSWTTDADASVSETVSGLSADTTYHYRLVATNSSGTSYGSDRSFQTTQTAPIDPAPSSVGGGGGSGCFLTTAAAGMDPGARK
jgi:phosphodiesterase/alkaline phosphatase D-like protein